MINAFETITKYCEEHNKNIIIRNHAFCFYVQNLSEAIDNRENPTRRDIEKTSNDLLTRHSISGYISKAEKFEKDITNQIVTPYIKREKNGNFWISVLASFLASFLFSASLLLFFIVARDQMKTFVGWISK